MAEDRDDTRAASVDMAEEAFDHAALARDADEDYDADDREPHAGSADEEGASGAVETDAETGGDSRPALDPAQQMRCIEAILFCAEQPLDYDALRAKLAAAGAPDADLVTILTHLQADYSARGINLVCHGGGWAFRTAIDLAPVLRGEKAAPPPKKPPRAAVETLAIIAYHQPVTRAEIESIRGVATSRGTLDILMEAGWVRPGRRRETPGRPVTWLTTPAFLAHFGLASLKDLPGIEELKASGLLDAKPILATLPAEPELDEVGVKGLESGEDGDENDDWDIEDEDADIDDAQVA